MDWKPLNIRTVFKTGDSFPG